jgi:hypothetical protein
MPIEVTLVLLPIGIVATWGFIWFICTIIAGGE